MYSMQSVVNCGRTIFKMHIVRTESIEWVHKRNIFESRDELFSLWHRNDPYSV